MFGSHQNPFAYQADYLGNLIAKLKRIEATDRTLLPRQLLSAISASLDAGPTFLVRYTNQEGTSVEFIESESVEMGQRNDSVLAPILESLLRIEKRELQRMSHGFVMNMNLPGSDKHSSSILVVPVKHDFFRAFVVVNNVPSDHLRFDEVIGTTIASLYAATNELDLLDLVEIESTVLDTLKSHYGYVPGDIYQHRFDLFLNQLRSTTHYFVPTVHLGYSIEIDSWEALLLDPSTGRLPMDIFRAADLWGSKFRRELDIYSTKAAIASYRLAWERKNNGIRMVPLTLNVYAETLFSDQYINELKVLNRGVMGEMDMILEISDRHPIAKQRASGHDREEMSELARRLQNIANSSQIRFGLDDFGVGYSSLSRWAELPFAQVKLDRDLLRLPNPEITLGFILDTVNGTHSSPVKVIVEGVDAETVASLGTLYNRLGIRYFQGSFFGEPTRSLYDLSTDLISAMQKILNQ